MRRTNATIAAKVRSAAASTTCPRSEPKSLELWRGLAAMKYLDRRAAKAAESYRQMRSMSAELLAFLRLNGAVRRTCDNLLHAKASCQLRHSRLSVGTGAGGAAPPARRGAIQGSRVLRDHFRRGLRRRQLVGSDRGVGRGRPQNPRFSHEPQLRAA